MQYLTFKYEYRTVDFRVMSFKPWKSCYYRHESFALDVAENLLRCVLGWGFFDFEDFIVVWIFFLFFFLKTKQPQVREQVTAGVDYELRILSPMP